MESNPPSSNPSAETSATEASELRLTPFHIEGDSIDVAEVMSQIRQRIREKKERGIYSDEEVQELSELKIQTFAESSEIDSELLRKLLEPSHSWNIQANYRITTHRLGLKGKIIVWAKKLVRPLVRLYTDHIVNRQAQLNLYLTYLAHNLTKELTRLQIEHRKVDYRNQTLQREVDFLKERLRALEDLAVLKEEPQPSPGPVSGEHA